jgi:tetratricopeptide (TPR) repeat protein
MKKTLITLLVVAPMLVLGQVKPSIPKAEKALREGKIDEAKTIIDATTGSNDFMVDKKGKPTKNAAKAWYLRGLIYFAMDTTKNTAFKNLDPNPFQQGKEAFEKATALDSTEITFFNEPTGLPMLNDNVRMIIGNAYFNQAINAYNEENDQKKALAYAERTMYFIPKDTTVLFYSSAFALSAGEPEKGVSLMERYFAAGGKNAAAYASIANIFIEKKDHTTALKWIKEGQAQFPAYRDLRLLELNIYLSDKKYDVAKAMVESELKSDPSNRDNHYLYAQLNRELGDLDKAKASFKKALEIDPKFFDAAYEVSQLYWADAKKFKDEMGALGNSKADLQKKIAIDAKYLESLKTYLPYIEACEKISPDDVNVLYSLFTVYSDLDDRAKVERTRKRLKALGEDI